MHKDQIKLARRYPNVFIGDGTYCTNEHDMPLYHIVGMNAQNKTISACFCFMKKDMVKQADYEWLFSYFKYYVFFFDGDNENVPLYNEMLWYCT